MYHILFVGGLIVGYLFCALGGALVERKLRLERRGVICSVLMLVLVGVVVYLERHHHKVCEAACNPDLVHDCRWDWSICVPNMPRSVKLEAKHGSR